MHYNNIRKLAPLQGGWGQTIKTKISPPEGGWGARPKIEPAVLNGNKQEGRETHFLVNSKNLE
jgi:hypothetical protein